MLFLSQPPLFIPFIPYFALSLFLSWLLLSLARSVHCRIIQSKIVLTVSINILEIFFPIISNYGNNNILDVMFVCFHPKNVFKNFEQMFLSPKGSNDGIGFIKKKGSSRRQGKIIIFLFIFTHIHPLLSPPLRRSMLQIVCHALITFPK